MTTRRGSDHKDAKLTEDDVLLIRELNAERLALLAQARNVSVKSIADKFDIHEGHVRKICSGECWTHV